MSELIIWNRALAIISSPRITSITELSSSKTMIDDHYVSVVKDFVCLHPWDGCTTIVDLVEDGGIVKPDHWSTAFTLPSDFEQAWRLNDQEGGRGSQPLWEILALPAGAPTAKFLLTDGGNAKLLYSFAPNTDALIDLLSGTIQTALSYRLAIVLARAWGKRDQDMQVIQREAQEAAYEARLSNGRQQKVKRHRDRPLVDARFANITRGPRG